MAETSEWLQDGMPVLKVIASPSKVPETAASKQLTVLYMNRVEALIDSERVLRRILQSMGIWQSPGETGES